MLLWVAKWVWVQLLRNCFLVARLCGTLVLVSIWLWHVASARASLALSHVSCFKGVLTSLLSCYGIPYADSA